MKNLDKGLRYITLIVLTSFITFMVTASYIYSRIDDYSALGTNQEIKPNTSTQSNFPLLDSVYKMIEETFYDKVDKDVLEQEAIRGLLYGLGDDYTYYMDKEEYESFSIDVTGSFSGVGLSLFYNVDVNKIEVLTPLKNTPAYESNIKQGDYVVKVDGVSYTGEQMQTAVNNIRGKAGTPVVLTIQRGQEEFDVTVVRSEIDIEQLEYEMLDGNIGYIEIASFDENVSKDFVDAYNELLKQGMRKLIIDLRDNPGGILSEVLTMADILIPEGIIVSTVDKDGNKQEYTSHKEYVNIPLVILVNGASASASEILACAVQDHGVGTIVGTKTYGKGLIQRAYTIENGGAIKVTVGEYFSPNGNKIDKVGVMPDVQIEYNYNEQIDTQLNKAIEILNK